MAEGDAVHEDAGFLGIDRTIKDGGIALHVHAEVDHQGGVAAVVHDEVGTGTVGPRQRHFRAPPIVLKRFALPRKNLGVTEVRDGGGGVILRGENVAGGPADVSPQRVQGLNEHGRLDGHVQRTHDLKALQGLGVAVTADEFHEAGHFALGKLHFLFAEVSEGNIGHLVGQRKIKRFRVGHVRLHKKLSVTGAGPV